MEFISSIHPIIVSILGATIFIAIWGAVNYALNNSKAIKAEKEARDAELEDLIQEIDNCREEARSLLIDYKKEKDKVAELEKSNSIEKENLSNTIEELKLKLTGCEIREKLAELKPISKPRVSKYDKPNTLYIAYDFNIRGNKSFKEVLKEIKEADIEGRDKKPLCTTAIHFLEYKYLNHFENIYLVRKNGNYIDIRDFRENPDNYSQMVSLTISQLILEPYAKLKFAKDKKDI